MYLGKYTFQLCSGCLNYVVVCINIFLEGEVSVIVWIKSTTYNAVPTLTYVLHCTYVRKYLLTYDVYWSTVMLL